MNAFYKAYNLKSNLNIINICSGIPISIKNVLKKIEKVFNKKFVVKLIDKNKDKIQNYCIYGNLSNARKKLNWHPEYSLNRGLDEIKKIILNSVKFKNKI